MNIEKKRKKMFKLLERKELLTKEFYAKYKGPGFRKETIRLFKYRKKYLKYIIARLKPFPIKIKTFWNEELWTFLPKELGLCLFGLLSSEQEIRLAKFFIKNLTEKAIFYDIGAHCGFYSVLAQQFLYGGEIHAFEPVPKIFNLLQKNLLQNNLSKQNEIFLNALALSNRNEEIDFYEDLQGGGRSTSSLSNLVSDLNYPPFKKRMVNAITLDEYCSKHLSPNFLKIDIEGGEQNMVEGGIETFKNTNPIIAMEVCRKSLNNQSHLQAMKILYYLKYDSYKIKENGELESIETINPENDIPEKIRWDNFIFKKHKKIICIL